MELPVEWVVDALKFAEMEAEEVLLPRKERELRAEKRRQKRIFMTEFCVTKEGVKEIEVLEVRESMGRIKALLCAVCGLTAKSATIAPLQQLGDLLVSQADLLRAGGERSIKIA